MGATLQDQKPSPIERAIQKFGAYFEERGLGPADLPAAIIVHEVLGMIMASTAWAVSFLLILIFDLALILVRIIAKISCNSRNSNKGPYTSD